MSNALAGTTGNSRPLETLLPVFFFISGITGLIYEILWTRLITAIIGAAPFAVSTILTVFMTGLGLGAYLAGKLADRVREPGGLIRYYGILEIAVGLYGLLLPFLIKLVKPLFSVLYSGLYGSFLLYSVLTLLGCSLLFLFPALCMGATLPLVSRYYVSGHDRAGNRLGFLYGLNTLGGAAGALITGFWLLRFWGLWGSLAAAVSANILVGAVSIYYAARDETLFPADDPFLLDSLPEEDDKLYPFGVAFLALLIFAVSGFASMSCEVIWTRLLSIIIGPTTYSFTIVLVTFIAGLGLGSMFFGVLAAKTKDCLRLLFVSQALAAFSALAVSHLLGNSQVFFGKLIYYLADRFSLLMLSESLVIFVMLIFPALFFGASFPLVIEILSRQRGTTGESVGSAYALNTAGAVTGSFAAGFIMIPLFGKENAIRFVVMLQLAVMAASVAYLYLRRSCRRTTVMTFGSIALLGVVLALPFPRWDREALAVGKYQRSFDDADRLGLGWFDAFFFGAKAMRGYFPGDILFYGDGIGGFTTVKRSFDTDGFPMMSLFNSAKSDASNGGPDMCTETMLAHLPMLCHSRPDDVLVIGLASGITAGETLHYPVKQLDVVDINRQVVRASDFFRRWNGDVLDDPRTHVIIQDGRAHLTMSDKRYDVIISEPSNPWMAGLASLFTEEFFSLAKGRLKEGGMYVQWIHSYMIDWENFSLVGRTFAAVFPGAVMFETGNGADYLLVGFDGRTGLNDVSAMGNLAYAQKSELVSISDHRVFYNMFISDDLGGLFGEGPLNSDSMPRLEFSAPRLMNASEFEIDNILAGRDHISEKYLAVMEKLESDTDRCLDYIEYILSFDDMHEYVEDYIDTETLSEPQFQRLKSCYVSYCSRRFIEDFSFVPKGDIRDAAKRAQIERLSGRIDKTPFKGNLLKQLGKLSYELGSLEDAERWYRQLIALHPQLPLAHHDLAVVLLSEGRYDDAAEAFRAEMAINPSHLNTLNSLGNLAMMKGNVEEAVGLYRKALKVDEEYYKAHLNLGAAFDRLDMKEEAAYHKAEGQRLKPVQ